MADQDFSRMDVESLAHECKHQTRLYFQTKQSETRYCFELLIRALRDENEQALAHMYRIYQPILAGRARKHLAFPDSCRDANLLAYTALTQYYFAVRKEQFLDKFDVLPRAIAYMYACLHTTILMDIRKHARMTELEPDRYAVLFNRDSSPEILKKIDELLPAEDDRLLVRLRFVYAMKPAEIAKSYAQIWASARDVSVAVQRIRRRLSTNPTLREFAGLDPIESDRKKDD